MKPEQIRMNYIMTVTCLMIILFVYAALTKLADYETFSVQLGQSPMLTRFAHWLAWVVPALEVIIASLLSLERTRLSGLIVSLGMMTAFTVYIILVSRYSYYVPCSCGGILENLSWNAHLILNIGFVILLLIALLIYPDNKRTLATQYPNASG